MRKRQPIPELTETQVRCFWALVQVAGPDECWPWIGGVTKAANSQDYGIWHIRTDSTGKLVNLRPHRVAWTLANGPIPDGLDIDHVFGKCSTSLCCNAAHIEPVTTGENVRRYYLSRTHCKRGHEITEHGHSCRPCNNERLRLKRQRSTTITENPIAALIH